MNPENQHLTRDQVGSIVKMLDLTRAQEFTCDECLIHSAEFAEARLAGLPLDEALALVEHHVSICPECAEECEALMQILKAST